MIGISADFDPVHNGHENLIAKAREIADENGDKVAIYLNKGYSANHGPFFTHYEARKEMALKLGADKVIPIEGLHHRLTLSYSVPIRIAMMIEDGVVDYVDAADVSKKEIGDYSKRFVKQGIFIGIDRNLPNRNVIRWFAVNEFLKKKYNRNMNFHIIPELKVNESKISGRNIRNSITQNMEIPEEIKDLLPKSTIKILEREIKKNNINKLRNWKDILHKLNSYSRSDLMKIAYLNGNVINEIVKRRKHHDFESVWGTFRRGNYGPVLTRLAISSIEENVKREEVLRLIRTYESNGVVPPEQSIDKVIERAWYVASENQKGINAAVANKSFMEIKGNVGDYPLKITSGLNLTSFESEKIKKNIDELKTELYIDANGKIACQIKKGKFKIKTKLKLPKDEVTYLRYLIDSHFIPIRSKLIKKDKNFRIDIEIIDKFNENKRSLGKYSNG
ncbi:MAG: nucleotidyltransferase family protein [Methanobrevibacter sp.]|jgi:predicted nucleotidyltransferase|nr:nucleotidyltransferase family protein [Candidatus Methanovirga australis]